MNIYNLIERLEAYRKGNRISKAEMSRIMDCTSPEQYIQWVIRDNLPKKYWDTALRILGNPGELTKAQIELLEKMDQLSDKDKKVIETLVDQMLSAE